MSMPAARPPASRTDAPAPSAPDPVGEATAFPRSHSLLFAGGVLAASCALYLYSIAIYPSSFTILTGGYCLISMVAVLLPMLLLRDETIASPIVMLTICVFVTMPVRFAYLVGANRGQGSLWHPIAVGQADYMEAAAITAFAFCLFTAVYLATRVLLAGRPAAVRVRAAPRVISVPRYALMAVFCLVISTAFAIIYIKVIGFSWGDIDTLSRKRGGGVDSGMAGLPFFALTWITDFPRLLLIVSIADLALTGRGRLVHLALLPPLLFLAIFWPFLTSVRQEILFILISLFLAYYIVRKSIPVLAVGSASIFGLLMFGLMTALRDRELRQSIGDISFVQLGIGAIGGSFNLGGFVALAHALVVVPSKLALQYGQTFLDVFWMVVPRAIWPDKPLAIGYLWLDAFGGDVATRAGGGAAPGLIAEGYLNFATIGAVGVMGAYAILIAAFYHLFFLRRRPGTFGTALYLVLLPSFTLSMYGYFFSKGFLDLAKTGVALILIFGFLFIRERIGAMVARDPSDAGPGRAAPIPPGRPRALWQRRLDRVAKEGAVP